MMAKGSGTPRCGVCGGSIPEQQMRHGVLADALAGIPGLDAKAMPNVMEELAMRCNRCGGWICSQCAVRTAQSAGAGMIQHEGCGGMFETP
jgi:hypothetical protein